MKYVTNIHGYLPEEGLRLLQTATLTHSSLPRSFN
uniref:Uncharacterized protein n=1 Tax=Anguilla anguilla TaxID=7936 RepID=A0A0E9UJ65_ANGAN